MANLLRNLRNLAPGHRTDYQRVLSRAPWSGLRLGCALVRFLFDHLVPDGPVRLVGDDTVNGHPGPKVYGKARHRDAVRSSHSYVAWRYGHKWVVLAVLVQFPFATRPWALPVLVDLYRSEADNQARRRPHRTPAQLMARLLRLLLIRFPNRSFVFAGDAGYGVRYFLYEYEEHLCKGETPRLAWDVLDRLDLEKTIEHVLPQTPTDVYWTEQFDAAARERWGVERTAGSVRALSSRCVSPGMA